MDKVNVVIEAASKPAQISPLVQEVMKVINQTNSAVIPRDQFK
jgi:hypothetical protein